MIPKHLLPVGAGIISAFAFANGEIVIGICFVLIAILFIPSLIGMVGKATGLPTGGKQKAIATLLLLAVAGGMSFFNDQQWQRDQQQRLVLIAQGDSLIRIANEQLSTMKPDVALVLARQADSCFQVADGIDSEQEVKHRPKSTMLIKQTTEAMERVATARKLTDVEFAEFVSQSPSIADVAAASTTEKPAFELAVQRYHDTALREQEAKRPGLTKIYAARKALAKREAIAAEKARVQEAAKEAAAERVAKIVARREYAEHARDVFLDGGMDIKVKVSGKNADILNLSYALFSDVWTHKMEKEGLREQWRELGFRRVNLTDNYDFNVYYDLK